jgi:hypothetical protein
MTAVDFMIRSVVTGRCLGHATVCAEAHYAAIVWRRSRDLERRLAPSGLWRELQVQIAAGLGNGAVSPHAAASVILIAADARPSRRLHVLQTETIAVENRFQVTPTLDARLLAISVAA